jgi:hypothetical protein
MSRKYRVDQVLSELSDDERVAYQAMLRQPATTLDDLLQWLDERGCRISRGAVWKHRRNFSETLEGVRRSAELARAFADVAREGGVESLGEASLARFQQLMTEKLLSLDASGDLPAKELLQLSMAMHSAAGTRQRIERIKAEFEQRRRQALAAAEAAAATGNPQSVVDAIKQALGIVQPAGIA